MKKPILVLVLPILGAAAAAAQTVIPDGLDCENLTSSQAAYEEYCERARSAQAARQAGRPGAGAAEDNFWKGGAPGGNDESADTDFWSGGEPSDPDASTAGQDFWTGAGAASGTQDAAVGDFWTGAESEGGAGEAQEGGAVPWYNIKYECYAADAKGLEIRQAVKESGPDFLEVVVELRFVDLHPKYHRNVLIMRYSNFGTGERKRWIALMGAGLKNGSGWTSPPIRIPRTWSFDRGPTPYTATWDDSRNRYRLSHWPDEEPYDKSLEQELFGVAVECYQHDSIDPRWKKVRL